MVKIEVTEEQAKLIQYALDMYSRIGVGQFSVIVDHPTFKKHLEKMFTPKKEIEVGDSTPQGEVLEVKDGKALIDGSVNKDGHWCKKKKWIKISDVKLSPDYVKVHQTEDYAKRVLYSARNILFVDETIGENGSWGIHNAKVDNSCREAFDILQVIRHEFWKRQEDRSFMTVDSSLHFTSTTKDSEKIKVEITNN